MKNFEDVKRLLEQERRKNERIQESSCSNASEPLKVKSSSSSIPADTCSSSGSSNNECSSRHNSGSASEPENEEVKTKEKIIRQILMLFLQPITA